VFPGLFPTAGTTPTTPLDLAAAAEDEGASCGVVSFAILAINGCFMYRIGPASVRKRLHERANKDIILGNMMKITKKRMEIVYDQRI
jgi:hypothetical protein